MVIVNSGINDNSWKSLTITNDSSATTSDSSIFSNFILESNKSYILEIYPTNSSIKVYKNTLNILYKVFFREEPRYFNRFAASDSDYKLNCDNDGKLIIGSYDPTINLSHEFDDCVNYIGGVYEIKLYHKLLSDLEITNTIVDLQYGLEPEPEPIELEPIEPEPVELELEYEPELISKGEFKKLEILYLYNTDDSGGNDWDSYTDGIHPTYTFFGNLLDEIFEKSSIEGVNNWSYESYDLANGFPSLDYSNNSVYLNKYDLIFTASPAGTFSNNTWDLYKTNKTIIDRYVYTGGVFFYRLAGWIETIGSTIITPGNVVSQSASFSWDDLAIQIKSLGDIESIRAGATGLSNDNILGYPKIPALISLNINDISEWSLNVKNFKKHWVYYDYGLLMDKVALLTYDYGMGTVIINTTTEGAYMNSVLPVDIEYKTYFGNTMLWGFQRTGYAKSINKYLVADVIEKKSNFLNARIDNNIPLIFDSILPNKSASISNRVIEPNIITNKVSEGLNITYKLSEILDILTNSSDIDITYTSKLVENVFYSNTKGIYNDWTLWKGNIDNNTILWERTPSQKPDDILVSSNEIYGLSNYSYLNSDSAPPRVPIAYYLNDLLLSYTILSSEILSEPEPEPVEPELIEPELELEPELDLVEPELEPEPELEVLLKTVIEPELEL